MGTHRTGSIDRGQPEYRIIVNCTACRWCVGLRLIVYVETKTQCPCSTARRASGISIGGERFEIGLIQVPMSGRSSKSGRSGHRPLNEAPFEVHDARGRSGTLRRWCGTPNEEERVGKSPPIASRSCPLRESHSRLVIPFCGLDQPVRNAAVPCGSINRLGDPIWVSAGDVRIPGEFRGRFPRSSSGPTIRLAGGCE